MRKRFIVLTIVATLFAAGILTVTVPFIVLSVKTNSLQADYTYLRKDAKYSTKVGVEGVELVTQHISCGYATIEMMSSFYGAKVSEDDLSAKNNGNISTSSSGGFLSELSRSIPSKKFVDKKYLKNDELLKDVHDSLDKGNPVAVEWAAYYEKEWTLHLSLVSEIDIGGDQVTVYNPYGYIEYLTLSEFLGRTTFTSFEKIPPALGFGFAFGIFDKNAVFHAE